VKTRGALLMGGLLIAGAAQAAPTVTLVEGEAMVRFADGGEWVPLLADTPLEPGDRLRAGEGARVELADADGDAWEMAEASDLEIGPEKNGESSFRLWLGGLLSKIAPIPPKKFEVHTPVAVVAVRGTEFAVDVDEDGDSQVGVTEGAVGFSSADPAAAGELRVAAQEGGVARRGKAPERLTEWTPRLARRLARMEAFRARVPLMAARYQHLHPARRREIRRALQDRWNRLPPQQRRALRQRMERRWPRRR
jgi:hypothetical protein